MTTLSRTVEYLARVCGARLLGARQAEVTAITHDSRTAGPGALFAALRGETTDGHKYIETALASVATAVLAEELPEGFVLPEGRSLLLVEDSREALAQVAAAFYGYPASQVTLVGLTGTNGKTTSTYIVQSIAKAAGLLAGRIGTLGAEGPGGQLYKGLTTPEIDDLQRLLWQIGEQGARLVAMEVSAHASARRRIAAVAYDALVFTNLTQDHLDYFGTMEAYGQAKRELFTNPEYHKPGFVPVLNLDDPFGASLAKELEPGAVTYSLEEQWADYLLEEARPVGKGAEATFILRGGERLTALVPLFGRFNLYNATGAVAVCHSLGMSPEAIAAGLAATPQVPGRMERVGERPAVLVDYAHTEDGLRQVLTAVKGSTPGRLIVVFGCGGDRDRTKRPKMGAVASELADLAVVTSDNPRSEVPEAIVEEIKTGMDLSRTVTQVDRRQAIFEALARAHPEDVVVIAGKGHEEGQIFKDKTVPFDDREVAREALATLKGELQE